MRLFSLKVTILAICLIPINILNAQENPIFNIGYYDLPASSLNDSFTAFTERVNMRTSSAIDKTNICIVDGEFKNKRVLTETFVWNSQLGSRLMWSTVCEKTLFYLDVENDNIITKEINVVNDFYKRGGSRPHYYSIREFIEGVQRSRTGAYSPF
jgi:hypothetical protein